MKSMICLSGGMDSASLLGWACASGDEVVKAVSFIYGSKHNPYETEAAEAVAAYYEVPFERIDLTPGFAGLHSNLMGDGGAIPEGHYEDSNMSKTVVPGRNLIFLAYLAGHAWSAGAEKIYAGIHSGDHAIYPDCRPEFAYAMMDTVCYATDEKVELDVPFLEWNKTSIIKWGLEHGVPYHLTRTCYKDQKISCGKCGACQERLEAFLANELDDPIPYETREILAV